MLQKERKELFELLSGIQERGEENSVIQLYHLLNLIFQKMEEEPTHELLLCSNLNQLVILMFQVDLRNEME